MGRRINGRMGQMQKALYNKKQWMNVEFVVLA